MSKQFVVFGLGRFGGNLVKEFYEMGVDVLAIDKSQDKVNEFAKYATHVVVANAIDEPTLKQLGVRNFDHAFVSFGDDVEASILTSLLLKEYGISQVWAKAQNEYHQKVLEKIGVDKVIHPERDMAKRIAHHIVSDKIIDYIELSKDYSVVEIIATDKIHNKSLLELDIRAKFGCNVVGIQRGEEINVSPSAEENILKGDVLIVMGQNQDIAEFESEGV
ncbi:potassium channel family protein [Metabacillus herbersteinensis]|uniref:Potassium channel family protein n=1 Tax=Metabacillus herbersteinensis TaxID=283816 RepID=A0ABV6GM29_9BACI